MEAGCSANQPELRRAGLATASTTITTNAAVFTDGQPPPYRRPKTIDETAAMITTAGGKAIAVRVDYTNEQEEL
jgi:hypothetical protein